MFTVLTRQPCEHAGFPQNILKVVKSFDTIRNSISITPESAPCPIPVNPSHAAAGLKALSRTPAIVALVVLLVSVVVLVAITLIQIHQKEVLPPGLKYGIVLDAGSSRTTVYVYQWPAEKENNTGVVSQTFRCSVRGSGISSYGNNPQDVPKAFEDCMQKVKLQIPAQLHRSTRVHLGGHGWDALAEKNLWHMWVHPHGVETTGALDLGGASTQISFAAEEKMGLNTSGLMQVSLYGYVYTLYTHSFQCYGRNEAEKRFLARLLQNSPTKTNLTNPCYPRNYITTFPMGDIFNSLCTLDLSPASFHPDDIITFEGTGDPPLCREKVAALFDFRACHDQEACSFDGVYQPKVKGPFVAFAGFYYTASALNLSGSFSLDAFNSSTWNFCSQNWNQLPLLLPRFDEEYARSYCFSAHYIYHLLVNGYRFTEETWPQISFKKEVGNSSIAWSLGYMLSLTNQIPAESSLIHLPLQPPVFVGILSFFTGVALLCLAFLVYLCAVSRIHRSSRHAFDHAVDSD